MGSATQQMIVGIEEQVIIGSILKYPDFMKEFAIETDASQVGLGAVLTQEYKVEGVSTTLPFGTFVFEHDAFVSGNFDTNFVKKFYSADIIKENQAKEAEVAALVALKQYFADQKVLRVPTEL